MAKEDIIEECRTESGELICERKKEHPDKTTSVVAEQRERRDAQCNRVIALRRGDPKQLDILDERMANIDVKCKVTKKPEDF